MASTTITLSAEDVDTLVGARFLEMLNEEQRLEIIKASVVAALNDWKTQSAVQQVVRAAIAAEAEKLLATPEMQEQIHTVAVAQIGEKIKQMCR